MRPKMTVLFLLSASIAFAQADYVYKIRISGCAHAPTRRSQSGFRVKGISGLWTTLHGVADCKTLTAERPADSKGPILRQNLDLRQLDLDHDVALLGSGELATMAPLGFEVAKTVDWSNIHRVAVYGFPYGIDLVRSVLDAREPPQVALASRLEDMDIKPFLDRKSPKLTNKVLDLEHGTLLPGESGAAVLDMQTNRVIALAEGGLKGGYAQISWSICYDTIILKRREAVANELSQLAEKPVNELFSFAEKDSPIPPERQLIKIGGIWQSSTGDCSNVVNFGGNVNLNCGK